MTIIAEYYHQILWCIFMCGRPLHICVRFIGIFAWYSKLVLLILISIKSVALTGFNIYAEHQLDQRNVNENWVKCYLFELSWIDCIGRAKWMQENDTKCLCETLIIFFFCYLNVLFVRFLWIILLFSRLYYCLLLHCCCCIIKLLNSCFEFNFIKQIFF